MSKYILSPTYPKYWKANKSPYTEKIKDITYTNSSTKHTSLHHNYKSKTSHNNANQLHQSYHTHSSTKSAATSHMLTPKKKNTAFTDNDNNNHETTGNLNTSSHTSSITSRIPNVLISNTPGINSNNNPQKQDDPIVWEMDLVNSTKAVYSLLTTIVSFYPKHVKIAGPYFKPPTIVWTTRGCVRNDIEELLEFEEDHRCSHVCFTIVSRK